MPLFYTILRYFCEKLEIMSNTGIIIKRYIWLIDLVRSQKLTRSQILRKWRDSSLNDTGTSMPQKTFHNHIDGIRDGLGLYIQCNRADGNTYTIGNGDDIGSSALADWLVSSISINNLISDSKDLKSRIIFENIPSGQKYLTQIISAMRDSMALEITYESFWSSNGPSTFEVKPYCLKVFKKRWYMVGLSENHDEPHVYCLDRITELSVTQKSFKMPGAFDAESFFADYFGVIVASDEPLETIRIKVTQNQDKYIDTLPLHPSQKLIERIDGYSIYEFRVHPTFDFTQEILSHGAAVEVLSPAYYRDQVANTLQEACEVYAR